MTRGVEHRIRALGAGIGHHARGQRALAAKGAQHQPPCPLCMSCPALHGARHPGTRSLPTEPPHRTDTSMTGRRSSKQRGSDTEGRDLLIRSAHPLLGLGARMRSGWRQGDKRWGGHGEDRAWKAQGTHLWHGLAPASGQLLPEEPAWSPQL